MFRGRAALDGYVKKEIAAHRNCFFWNRTSLKTVDTFYVFFCGILMSKLMGNGANNYNWLDYLTTILYCVFGFSENLCSAFAENCCEFVLLPNETFLFLCAGNCWQSVCWESMEYWVIVIRQQFRSHKYTYRSLATIIYVVYRSLIVVSYWLFCKSWICDILAAITLFRIILI